MLKSFAVIGIGAAMGALGRWGLGLALNKLFPLIPPGTLAANLIGGYFIGIAVSFFSHMPDISVEWRLFVITGFLGGLTTFSTFSAEIVAMLMQHRFTAAAIAAVLHVGGALLMTFLGIGTFALAKSLIKF